MRTYRVQERKQAPKVLPDDKPESLLAMLAYLLIVAGILAAFGTAILAQ